MFVCGSEQDTGWGEGTALYVGAPTHKAVRKYRKAAGIEEGALFRRVRWQKHITPDRLSVNGARNAIKRWAAEAGVEGFISGHSLRVGSAVSLAQAGASVVDMQTAGRWQGPEDAGELCASGAGGTRCGGSVLLRVVKGLAI